MEQIDNLLNEHNFSESEKEFVKKARNEETTSAISQQQVIASLINAKSTKRLSEDIKRSMSNLITTLNFSRDEINRSLKDMNESARSLKQGVEDLGDKIEDFSDSTTRLTEKANSLLKWYVGATIIIAILTAVNIYIHIKN